MALDPDTNLLSPIGHAQLKDAMSKIPVGGKITVYNTNSTVLAKIYKDPNGNSAWSNPILIDSLGHANLEIWLPVNKAYDFILSDSVGNIIQEFFGISGINDPTQGGGIDVSQLGEWVLAGTVIGQSPGYVEIEGDWTEKITPFKRLKLVILGERHGWVINVSTIGPGQGTRIEYELDDNVPIIGNISSVYYGLISHVNTSFPNFLGGAVFIKRGVDFTADPHMEIWDTSGNFHYVNGTAIISSLGVTTKTQPGSVKWLYFESDATITPTGNMIRTSSNEDIEVLAGDIVQVILDDATGISYAFGLLENTADLTQTQSIEKKQTVLSGDLDANGNPYLLKVPTLLRANSTMTANNSPEGYLATASTVFDGTGTYEPWKAFDGVSSSFWSSALNNVNGAWLNLLIPSQKRIRAYSIRSRTDSAYYPQSWYLQGSNDGINYETIDYQFDINNWTLGETKLFYLTYYPTLYNNFRLYFLSALGALAHAQINELILYEFQDDPNFTTIEKVFSPVFGSETTTITAVESFPPNMTSDSLPVPYVASSSNNYFPKMPYNAFDADITGTGWQATENFVAGEWLKIDLGTPKSITSYTITSTNSFALKASSPLDFLLFGSTDNTNWTQVDFRTGVPWLPESEEVKTFQLSSPSAKYRYYRFEIVQVSEAVIEVLPDVKYPPPLTANIDQGYTVIASSTDSSTFPWKAFDGSKLTSSRWFAFNATLPQWLYIEFPTAITLGKYKLTGSNTFCSPVDWTLEASIGGVTWVVLDTKVDAIWNTDSEDKEFFLPIPVGPYKYFRLNITKSNILAQPVGVIELELWVLSTVQLYKFGALINNLRFNSLVQQETLVDIPYPADQTKPSGFISASRTIGLPDIPPMTSDVLPAPYVVSASSTQTTIYFAWKGFNKSTASESDAWITATGQLTGWLKLKFPNKVCINSYSLIPRNDSASLTAAPRNWTIEGSDNDSTWTVLDTQTNQTGWLLQQMRFFKFVNYNSYQYYRINISLSNGHASWVAVGELLYSFNDPVPAMSSNAIPAPFVASASTIYSATYDAWKAFSKINTLETDSWLTPSGTLSGWLKIKLASTSVINYYAVVSRNFSDSYLTAPKTWTFEGSNDDTTWAVLDTRPIEINWIANETRGFYLNNTTSYLYYRINVTANNGSTSYVSIGKLVIKYSYDPSQAFDGSSSTGWYTGLPFTAGDWLKIDLQESVFISKYKIISEQKTDPPTGCPKDFVLEGSTDNVNWGLINSQTNVVWSGTLEEKIFILPANSAPYRYFRITTTETSNGSPVYIADFRVIKTDYAGAVTKILPMSSYGVYDGNSPIRFNKSPLVPVMTTSISPLGYVASESGIQAAGYNGYHVFDGDGVYSTANPGSWYSANVKPSWVQIKMPTRMRVKSFIIVPYISADNQTDHKPDSFELQGSNDGVSFITIKSWTPLAPTWLNWNGPRVFSLDQLSEPYLYFRLNVLAFTNVGVIILEWMLYDFDVWNVVPNMTSNVLPAGYVASANLEYAPYLAWQVFKDQYLSYFQSGSGVNPPHWIQIKLPAPVTLLFYTLSNYEGSANYCPVNFNISGSNDGVNWYVIQNYSLSSWSAYNHRIFNVYEQKIPYSYFRLNVFSLTGGSTSLILKLWRLFAYDPTKFKKTTYPEIAFDNKSLTAYHSDTLNFIKLKVPIPTAISKYSITPSSGDNLISWSLDASLDDIAWSVLDSQVNYPASSWAEGIDNEFPIVDSKGVWTYFRISVTETTDPYIPESKTEIVPIKNADTNPPGYISSASAYSVGNDAFKVFDGNDATIWTTGTTTVPAWVKIELPTAKIATAFRYYSPTPTITNYYIQGSTDNTNWVNLYNANGTANLLLGTFYFANTVAYKYYRFYINTTDATSSTNISIFQLYENVVPASGGSFDISEIKMYHQAPYKLYYESNVSSLHSFASGFDVKGWRNIPMLGPSRTYLGTDAYANNTFVASTLGKNGSVTINEEYRFPWLIADDSYFNLPSERQFPDWPIFWNGANSTFTPTNQSAIMTSNTEPVGYVASAQYEQAGNEAYTAFDALPDTYWRAGTAQIFSWIKLQIPTAIAIRGVIIQAPNLIGVGTPNSWTIDGSNDDVAWTVLDSVTGQIDWALGERRSFLFPENLTPYTYYRMNITNATLGTLNYFGIAQIDYYSFPETSAPTVIEDQYFNKGTITGVIGVTSNPTYNDKSVLDFRAGAILSYPRNAGFEITNFTYEVKIRLKSDASLGVIYPLNTTPQYCCCVEYYFPDKTFRLYLSSNGTTWNILSSSMVTAPYPLTVGEWYHIRLSFNGAVYILSVNDVELIKINSQTKIFIPTALQVGRNTTDGEIGYVYDLRYLPFYEPPDKVFDMPFYPILRYDPIMNLSSKLLDINYQFRTGANRWLTNTEFLVGEYNNNIYGAVTPITYAYGGVTYLPITVLQYPTGDPGFFQVNHIFGTFHFINSLVVHPLAPIGTIIGKGDKLPMDGVGYVSGAATWNGIRIPFLRYRNTIGIKWPQNDSADYLAIYTGSGAIGTVSGAELILSGIFKRNF